MGHGRGAGSGLSYGWDRSARACEARDDAARRCDSVLLRHVAVEPVVGRERGGAPRAVDPLHQHRGAVANIAARHLRPGWRGGGTTGGDGTGG